MTVIYLRAPGTSILVDLTDNRLPEIVHWGPDLGDLTESQAADAIHSARTYRGPNSLDEPIRVSVLPEHSAGWGGRPGLRGSRSGRAWSTRFSVTSVVLEGRPVDGFAAHGPGALVVSAADDDADLELTIELELLPSGLVRTRATLTNRGAPFGLEDLVLALPVPSHAENILDFAGRWGMERLAQTRDFTVGTHLRENRRGRTGADAATLLHVTEPGAWFARGETWGVHVGWSGDHTHYAERLFTGHRVIGGGELLLPGEVILAEGQSYSSPWLYGSYGDGFDAVARRFHQFLRSRPEHPDTRRPVVLNVWEAVYFDHNVDRLRTLADLAAEVGIERFVLDDGWFGSRRDDTSGLGDWVVSPDVWPEGLHPLVDHVRGLGMEFGLWVEPEMVNPDSDLARAHPEWIMSARSHWPIPARHQQVLNLGIPEAYDHVLGQLIALLDEYDISYLKWDHNRDLLEAGTQTDGGRPGVHEQTLATYRMLEEIKARHPGVEIESCSSGGSRVDLGILERTDRVWVSDCIDPLERQRLMRWTTQLIPAELMGSHIASPRSHSTGRRHDLSFRAITALFGHLGVEWDITTATDDQRAELAGWIALYKEHRDLLLSGDVVRGPDPDEALWVHGVVSTDRSEALIAAATLGWTPEQPAPRIRVRGLDPDRTYRVESLRVGPPPAGFVAPPWWDGSVELTGGVLERLGVTPPSLHPEQAVLLRFVAQPRTAG